MLELQKHAGHEECSVVLQRALELSVSDMEVSRVLSLREMYEFYFVFLLVDKVDVVLHLV